MHCYTAGSRQYALNRIAGAGGPVILPGCAQPSPPSLSSSLPGGVQAAGKAAVGVQQMLADPKGHYGETVVVHETRGVAPGLGGFICEATAGGQQFRLDASGLGGGTTEAIADKLIGPCNRIAALAKPTCTFDGTFVPTGSGFEDGVTIINTPVIDMSGPRRR